MVKELNEINNLGDVEAEVKASSEVGGEDENSGVVVAAPVNGRDISIVTAEIHELSRQANTMVLWYAIEIGRRLCEAKELLNHGEWGDWLARNIKFSHSKVNDLMKLFREYGAEQITLFGAVTNSQTFANLPYSKALQLLAVPSEEREEFAREVGVEDLSSRELAQVIKERDEARKAASEAQAREKELKDKADKADQAANEARQKASAADALRAEVTRLEKAVQKANESASEWKDKYDGAIANPQIPEDRLEEAKAEAEAAAQRELDELKKQLETAENEAKRAEEARIKAEEQLAMVENKLKTAAPEVAEFRAIYEEAQRVSNVLVDKLKEINRTEHETAVKLLRAVHALGDALKGAEI